jgi:hypothetical protein
MEDWYQITKTIIVANKGGYLLNTYGYSPSRALAAVYPQYKWEPWKFLNVPKYFWQYPTNQGNYLNSLGNKLGVKTLEDWYNVSFEVVRDNQGAGLLDRFHSSMYRCLQSAYPEHTWFPWKFSCVPGRFWTKIENQKIFFDWLGEQLVC